ncbi:DUF2059 domain-containing protein [Janthinobacterium fluminis]|uniref:DUF2059 domain-containing protein n=1 Tax=Janthinobacterium fluminis TaxID=2987524 RepID=A0ABT5K3R2_9BURK|nr:DUF2059 domain-containing protein [Janthinobacterium fluminis]MDC8759559.1 DUF2059 domain-containing protein [Janthinobacterium fluminis]
MHKLLKVGIFLFSSLTCVASHAETPAADMDQASKNYVKALDLGKNWPTMIEDASVSGAEIVKNSALEGIDENLTMTDDQRRKARVLVVEMAPQISEEIRNFQRSIVIPTLVNEMMEASYQKYYSAQEIQDMADFYGSPTFQKRRIVNDEIAAESKRSGASPDSLEAQYAARFTPQEKQFMDDFVNSATAKKMQQVGAKVDAAMRKFLQQRIMSDVQTIVNKYGKILADRIREQQ